MPLTRSLALLALATLPIAPLLKAAEIPADGPDHLLYTPPPGKTYYHLQVVSITPWGFHEYPPEYRALPVVFPATISVNELVQAVGKYNAENLNWRESGIGKFLCPLSNNRYEASTTIILSELLEEERRDPIANLAKKHPWLETQAKLAPGLNKFYKAPLYIDRTEKSGVYKLRGKKGKRQLTLNKITIMPTDSAKHTTLNTLIPRNDQVAPKPRPSLPCSNTTSPPPPLLKDDSTTSTLPPPTRTPTKLPKLPEHAPSISLAVIILLLGYCQHDTTKQRSRKRRSNMGKKRPSRGYNKKSQGKKTLC